MAVWEPQQLFYKEFEAAPATLGSKYATGLQIIFFSVSELVDFFLLVPAATLHTNAVWICNLLQRKVALSILQSFQSKLKISNTYIHNSNASA